MPECHCYRDEVDGRPYVGWIYHVFADCVYSPVETAAFIIGMTSLGFWLVCQLPQFIKNWQLMSVEALSIWFLLEWLGGDVLNFTGSYLVKVVPTQLYLAAWFCVMDVFILTQYAYLTWYNWGKPDTAALKAEQEASELDVSVNHTSGGQDAGTFQGGSAGMISSGGAADPKKGSIERPLLMRRSGWGGFVVAGATIVSVSLTMVSLYLSTTPTTPDSTTITPTTGARQLKLNTCISEVPVSQAANTAGVVIGWISSVLYLNSRLPQVYKNWKRGTVEGLSWLMFCCSFMGNVTSTLGIVMRATTRADWVRESPFLPGMMGTIFLDFIIIMQVVVYNRRAFARRERRALLRDRAEHGDPRAAALPANLLTDTPQLISGTAKRGLWDIYEEVPTPIDPPAA